MAVLIGNEVIENSLEGYGARGTLASDPTTGTTFTTTTGHGARFPVVDTGQILRLQCEDEIVWCTAHTASSETFTVLRGQESTSNVAHAALAPVNAVVSAGTMATIGSRWGVTHYRAGRYYGPSVGNSPDAGGGYGANRLVWAQFFVAEDRTFDRIGCGVTVAVASTTQGLGIWKNDRAGIPGPGTLVLDAGTVDSSTTGYKEITISQALPAGLHWLGVRSNGVGTVSIRRTLTTQIILGTNTLGTYTGAPYFDSAAAFASDPAWAEAGLLGVPYVFLRTV